MGNKRLPGPVCTVLNDWLEIDAGAACRGTATPPGPVGTTPAAKMSEKEAKADFLSHARQVSYAMQAKSMLPGGHSWLGGSFLRMYLDHEVDEDTVAKAGEEIAASDTFLKLSKDTNDHLQHAATKHGRMLTEQEIATVARNYLQARNKKRGIAFRGALNPVIGGITAIDVDPKIKLTNLPATEEKISADYELGVTLSDTYDFDNRRTGEYDHYRKRLARLLTENKFQEFNKAYRTEMQPVDSWHKTKLDNAALFASFMYAVEKKGWTSGPLAWKTTVAMKGHLQVKSAKPKKPAEVPSKDKKPR